MRRFGWLDRFIIRAQRPGFSPGFTAGLLSGGGGWVWGRWRGSKTWHLSHGLTTMLSNYVFKLFLSACAEDHTIKYGRTRRRTKSLEFWMNDLSASSSARLRKILMLNFNALRSTGWYLFVCLCINFQMTFKHARKVLRDMHASELKRVSSYLVSGLSCFAKFTSLAEGF